jgi:stage II sporulation protein D
MLALVLALCAAVSGNQTPAPVPTDTETVRIAVGRFQDAVVIEGNDLVVRRSDGQAIGTKATRVKLSLGKSGLFLDGKPLDRDVATVTGPLLKLAGHSYRGALEVRFATYKGKAEMLVVHPLELETYVTGIVSSELPRGWPLGAYQAQAVAARTFAVTQKYRRLELPYHMESSVLDQVYHGVEREHGLAEEAARTTRGLVLTSQRHLAQTYFHAACGGTTESALEGWGTAIDYLPGSTCTKCMTSGTNRATWKVSVKRKDVDKAFASVAGGPISGLKIVARTESRRVKKVELQSGKKRKTITGADFRRLLGWSVVWSTQIDSVILTKTELVVAGRGSGHGVGLCQWGAKGYADDGVPFDEILQRYYPGAALTRLY